MNTKANSSKNRFKETSKEFAFFYSDTFDIPLPEKHRFPGGKYSQLRKALLQEGVVHKGQLMESPLAEIDRIKAVHCSEYVKAFTSGTIDDRKMRQIGFPWSEYLVKRIRATMGGALASAESALATGISGQLAGGTHHAHYDYGLGYCIFNDFAVVSQYLLDHRLCKKIAVIDLDVHQGDGNATMLAHKKEIFVFSLHGEKNFPFRKYSSDLDIGLPDNCDDEEYLKALDQGLESVKRFSPDIILYQAGVDILECDHLGRLNISLNGLLQRDAKVFNYAKDSQIPLSMAIGGGYAKDISKSVKGYVQTYKTAKDIYGF